MKGVTDASNKPNGERCDTCGEWIGGRGNDVPHDRKLHQIVALERIATALEQINHKED